MNKQKKEKGFVVIFVNENMEKVWEEETKKSILSYDLKRMTDKSCIDAYVCHSDGLHYDDLAEDDEYVMCYKDEHAEQVWDFGKKEEITQIYCNDEYPFNHYSEFDFFRNKDAIEIFAWILKNKMAG